MSGASRRPFASQEDSQIEARDACPKMMGSRQAGRFLASAVVLFQRAGRSMSIGWRGAMSCIFDDPRRFYRSGIIESYIE